MWMWDREHGRLSYAMACSRNIVCMGTQSWCGGAALLLSSCGRGEVAACAELAMALQPRPRSKREPGQTTSPVRNEAGYGGRPRIGGQRQHGAEKHRTAGVGDDTESGLSRLAAVAHYMLSLWRCSLTRGPHLLHSMRDTRRSECQNSGARVIQFGSEKQRTKIQKWNHNAVVRAHS